MPPRNPSELMRLEEERKEILKELKDLRHPKGYKEALLGDLRKIEATLGIEGKNYNSREFWSE